MGLKPMNCPAHVQLFADERRSYRDLPIRYSEAGLVHRHEPSGALHGLLRVRHITQDDAHIFCRPEQVEDEVDPLPGLRLPHLRPLRLRAAARALDAARRTASARTRCGTTPRPRWPTRSSAAGCAYELNPGDGAFYGPKIDLHMTDSIGRSWQLGTVQLDYAMPERFGLDLHRARTTPSTAPVMIHRALLGSFERFIGILIEHYAGEFPLWLAPVQAIVLPIADRHLEAAQEVADAAARGRRTRRGRRAHGVRRPQDPRRRAAQGALHARRRRPRGRGGRGVGPPPRPGRRRRGGGRRRRDAARRRRRASASAARRRPRREARQLPVTGPRGFVAAGTPRCRLVGSRSPAPPAGPARPPRLRTLGPVAAPLRAGVPLDRLDRLPVLAAAAHRAGAARSTSPAASASGGAGWPGSRACRRAAPCSSRAAARSTPSACAWPSTSSGWARDGAVLRVDRGVGPGRLRWCRAAGGVLECAAGQRRRIRRRGSVAWLYFIVLIFTLARHPAAKRLTVRRHHHS